MSLSVEAETAFRIKIRVRVKLAFIYDKKKNTFQQSGNRVNVSEYNKGHIWQGHS